MNFSCSVEIAAPRETVARTYVDPENLHHWHPDLQSVELIEGEPGTVGARSHLKYRNFDLFETLTVCDLPDEWSGEYDTPGVCSNTMVNRFHEIAPQRTRYDVNIEYVMTGRIVRVLAFLMPWMFRKQVEKSMLMFRDYVESQASVSHASDGRSV